MESYLMITQINDFTFCPRSIYFHDIYRNTTDTAVYHQTPQKIGLAAHAAVDTHAYSSRKEILTSLMVYSEKYNLLGRIDILDTSKKILIERKFSVTAVYDGFRFQLFAQYFALREMGYEVHQLRLHSIKDNCNYEVPLPDEASTAAFEKCLADMRAFDLNAPFIPNPNKCAHCIYRSLCDCSTMEDEI